MFQHYGIGINTFLQTYLRVQNIFYTKDRPGGTDVKQMEKGNKKNGGKRTKIPKEGRPRA